MMYNPGIHKRKSIRLKGYNYSQAGLYFITICVQNRECLFGHVYNKQMILNGAGRMVAKWYFEIEKKYPDIKCHEMIVMPNHFHCVIENTETLRHVSETTLDTKTLRTGEHADGSGEHGDGSGEHLDGSGKHLDGPGEHADGSGEHADGSGEHADGSGEHIGSPLHAVVRWFKTMTTNEYIRGVKNLGWKPFNGKLWQRNYYEHIIRNEKSYQNISNYIIKNPTKWHYDKFYKK